ncbi:MAG: ATP-binding protein [Pseudomonadota bacterium]
MRLLRDKIIALSRSLGFRITTAVAVVLLLSFVVFIYLVVDIQNRIFFMQAIKEVESFSTAVVNATKHSMLSDDPATTGTIVRNMASQHDIREIRIYSHDGVIRFSNHPGEIGAKADKKAEACLACHSEDRPFSHVVASGRTRIFEREGRRRLGIITPIYNAPDCYNAACHVHPEAQKVLGVLDVGMSLKPFDAHVRSTVVRIIMLGIGTFIAVLATIVFYIVFRVHRPVSRLLDATKRLSAGDYTCAIPVESNDELGRLGLAFNIMRAQIDRRTQELVRSRGELKNLFEQVPCFICVINKDFEIVRQNSYMRDLFKGVTGMHCYEVFKRHSEKCLDCHVEQAFEDGKTKKREHCGITVSGEEANYVSYVTPIVDSRGAVGSAMIISVDVRDRVRLEKELRVSKDFQANLIENSIHGIIATDEYSCIAIFNRSAENLLGYRADDAIGSTSLDRYFPSAFLDKLQEAYAGRMIGDSRLVAQEQVVTSADGEAIPVRFSGVILFENGKTVGSVGFFQDLRTFKTLEREKLASDRLAVVGQTVAGLAHGIKNILQGLEGGVYVVRTAVEDDDRDLLIRGWGMVENNIGRISQLVQDLLNYSKDRAPQYEEIDLNLLAEEVCALFDIKAAKRSILIERDFDPSVGRTLKVCLDQRGIHTCLSNLVSNAIDACELDISKDRHKIVVSTRADGTDHVILEVSDDGVGMDEETRSKIFASFFSTKGSRGTGLGLLVTSKIVLEHDGEITFQSEPGAGSTFTITVPSGKKAGSREVGSAMEKLEQQSEQPPGPY